MFVEDFNIKEKIGCISVYELNDNKYKFLGKALEEPFHLSFPFIFEYSDNIYMIPEKQGVTILYLYINVLIFLLSGNLKNI